MTHDESLGTRMQLEVNGLRLSLLQFRGAGPDIVLIPGITTTANGFEFLARRLRDDYTVHVLDIRGRGKSDRALPGHYGLDDYAADLDGIVAALELQQPTMLGHSLGARIVARWAAGRSSHGPLVLVDPPLSGKNRPYPTPWSSFASQLSEAQAGTTPDAVRQWYPAWTDRELEIRARELPRCDLEAVRETYAGFEHDEFEPDWCQLTAPLALIRGAQSPMVSHGDATRLAEAAPHSAVATVPNAGHMVPWDNLEGFLSALRKVVPSATMQGGPR
jgi:N-formylmaleamate deformylase